MDELEPLFRQLHYCEVAEKEQMVCEMMMMFKDQMLDKMFPKGLRLVKDHDGEEVRDDI